MALSKFSWVYLPDGPGAEARAGAGAKAEVRALKAAEIVVAVSPPSLKAILVSLFLPVEEKKVW